MNVLAFDRIRRDPKGKSSDLSRMPRALRELLEHRARQAGNAATGEGS